MVKIEISLRIVNNLKKSGVIAAKAHYQTGFRNVA